MDWELEQLKRFIKSELEKGYRPDTVEKTLCKAGFPKAEVRRAFATLHKKPGKEKPKPTGPGFFKSFFFKEVKKEKPKLKKKVVKPKPPKKKTKPGFFAGMFGRKIKVQKTKSLPKLKPKPKPIKKPIKPIKKPKGPGFFATLFTHKPKPIKKLPPKLKQKPIKIKPKKKRKPFKFPKIPHLKGASAVIFLIIFFAAIGIIIWAFPASCATDNCFINKANQCKPATFSNIIEGTTLKYETNNCVLKKTVIGMAPNEPASIVQEFQGKSMLCTFRENDFSPLYINTISGLTNTCEGELKTAILKHIV